MLPEDDRVIETCRKEHFKCFSVNFRLVKLYIYIYIYIYICACVGVCK